MISCKVNEQNIAEFQTIDPLDPTNKVVVENETEFKSSWNGAVFLVSRETGVDLRIAFSTGGGLFLKFTDLKVYLGSHLLFRF